MDDRTSETQSSDALVTQSREPTTVIGTAAPRSPYARRGRLRPLIDEALDELDRLGDRVAVALGLR